MSQENTQLNAHPSGFAIDPEYTITLDAMEAMTKAFKGKLKLQQEPVAETQKLITLLEQAVVNQEALFAGNEAASKYFLKEVVPGFARTLALNIKIAAKNQEFLGLVRRVPTILAHLLAQNIADAELWDGVSKFFDHKVRIFTYHFLAEENQILQQSKGDLFTPEERAWREKLEVGSEIDALKLDQDGKRSMWSKATIKEVRGDNILVSFSQASASNDREISIFSNNVAEINTKSQDEYDWRNGLKVGDLFDCWDSTGSWYACTVLQLQEKQYQGSLTMMVSTAYRVYHEEGDKSDEKGKFFGWEPDYDDWQPLFSPRLAKYMTHTDGSLQSQTKEAQEKLDDKNKKSDAEKFDDSMDSQVINEKDGQRIYAVQRKQCKSDLINQFLNTFGRLGGFDMILQRIEQNLPDQLEMLLIATYAECIALSAPLFHRSFVDEYFAKFQSAMEKRLLNSSKAQLRHLKKEKVDKVIENMFEKFVLRLSNMTPEIKRNMQYSFEADLGIHFLNQDFLEKRIDGIKVLASTCYDCLDQLKKTDKGSPSAQITQDETRLQPARELVNKLMKNNFFLDEVYSSQKTHAELVKRCEKILRLMFGLRSLTHEHINFIWKITEQNDQFLETDMLKSVIGAATDMSIEDMKFLIAKINAIPIENLSDRYLQLVIEMGAMKHAEQDEQFQNEILQFLWRLTFESEGKSSLSVINSSSLAFSKRIKCLYFGQQLEFMYRLVDKLQKNQQGYLVLKTLYGILKNSCDPPSSHPEYENLGDVTNHLETEKGLLKVIFDNFTHYMNKVSQTVKDDKLDSKDLECQIIYDQFMHSDQVTQRLEFIKFYVKSSFQVSVTSQHLETLWDLLVLNSPVEKDSKQLYQWLREICDQVERLNLNNGEQPFVAMEDIIKFYHAKIASTEDKTEETYKLMLIEGFQCRQSFFVMVNSANRRLRKVNWETGMFKKADNKAAAETDDKANFKDKASKSFTSYSSDTGAQYKSYSFDQTTTASTGTETQTAPPLVGPLKPAYLNQTVQKDDKDEDPDDLEVESVVSPSELDGMNMLWTIATESASKAVIDAAAKLLISLYHGVARELKENIPEYDEQFINKVFEIIDTQVPVIKARSEEVKDQIVAALATLPTYASTIQILRVLPVQERKIVRAIFLLRQLVRASEKEGTYGLRPHSALNKGIELPNLQISNTFSGFNNKGHRSRFELSIDANCTLWELKKRLGIEIVKTSKDDGKTWDLYPLEGETEAPKPLHPACVRLFQMQQSKDIPDLNQGMTLSELSFKTNESIGCFKKSYQGQRKNPIVRQNEDGTYGLTQRASDITDECFYTFSVKNEEDKDIIGMKQIILYTAACTKTSSDEKDYRVNNFMKKYDIGDKGFVYLSEFRQFFLDSVINGNELALRNNFENLGYAPNLEKLPVNGDDDNVLQVRKSPKQMPRFRVSENQKQFQTLMQLNEFGGEVGKRAAEALNYHITNPVLFKRVEQISKESKQGEQYDWESIFDSSNVHQMIYTLEIIQALLMGQDDSEKVKKFIVSFVNKGGLKELQHRLTQGLQNLESQNSHTQKMYLDRLLQLIKIFVSATSGKQEEEEKPAEFDFEVVEEDKDFQTPTKPITRLQDATNEVFSNDIEISKSALFDDVGNDEEEELQAAVSNMKTQEEQAEKAVINKLSSEQLSLKKILSQQDIIAEISDKIDLQLLKQQSIQLVNLFTREKTFDVKDRPIVESCMQLWQKIQSEQAEQDFQDFDPALLKTGLISCSDRKVRECFRDTLAAVGKNQNVLFQFLQTFFKETLQTIGQTGGNTWQFFGLLRKLITKSTDKIEQLSSDYSLSLIEILVNVLKNHEAKETSKSLLSDQTLQGSLETITDILIELKDNKELQPQINEIIEKSDIVGIVMYRCLFLREGRSENYVNPEFKDQKAKSQCATKDSRRAGFRILKHIISLLKPKEMIEFLQTHIEPIVNEVERPKKWKHLPSSQNRENGYCGIVNLGCICYMISILQQFFMVPQFRYQLMKAEDKTPENMGEFKDEMFDDNLLRQLQIVFGYLEMSERQAASAKGMCLAYKDFDGQPTKIGEQKDSQEFLNFFLDRIENQLKPTSQKDLLKDIFRGNQCDQIICQSCGKVRSRIEQFFSLSLEVQGQQGIYQSLEQMKKGEILEGYNCEGCNQKVNAIKRQIIGQTPNMLILHLKRFVFSFDTYQNEKINSKFEFPKILDLKKYSVKGSMEESNDEEIKKLMEVDDDEFIYRLVGINIQEGSADSGHYYSFINTKRGDLEDDPFTEEEKWNRVSANPWREYNDSRVGLFNLERDVEKEAFGGESSNSQIGSTLTDDELGKFLSLGSGGYGKSAYMLFYERKKKSNLTEYTDEAQEQTKIVEYKNVPKAIPQWITDLVKKDNKSFLVDSQVFDELFFDFLKELFRTIGSDLVMTSHTYDWTYNRTYFPVLKQTSLNLLGNTVFNILAYYDKNISLANIIGSGTTIMTFCDSRFYLSEGSPSINGQFLQQFLLDDQGAHFFKIMFTCTDAHSRLNVGKLISASITRLIKLYDEFDEKDRQNENFASVRTVIDQSLDLLFGALKTKECRKAWVRLEAYFSMLNEIGTSCFAAKQVLMDRQDVISDLIDFILNQKSPRAKDEVEKRPIMGGVMTPPFQLLYNLISLLVRMSYTAHMDTSERLPTHCVLKDGDTKHHPVKTFFLSDEAVIMLTKTEFLEKVIFDTKFDECEEFAQALCHLCYRNLNVTRKVCKKFLKAISYSSNDQAERHLILLVALLKVKDEFQMERLEFLFGFPFLMEGEQPFQISSGIDARQYDDAVLNLLWKYKGRLQAFSLTILDKFGDLINNDDVILDYMSNLPSMNDMVGKFTDWIMPFLEEQIESTKKYSAGTGTEEKLSKITIVKSQFEEYFKKVAERGVSHKQYSIHNYEQRDIVSQCTFDKAVEITIKRVQGTFSERNPIVPEAEADKKSEEENSQEAQIQEKGPEEQAEVFNCNDIYYAVYAKNLMQANLKVKIEFVKINKEDTVDLDFPVGGIKDFLKPDNEFHVMNLRRINPFAAIDSEEREISKLNLNIKWKTYEHDDFNTSSYVSQLFGNKPSSSATNSSTGTGIGTNPLAQKSQDGRRGGILLGPMYDLQNQTKDTQESGNSPVHVESEAAATDNGNKTCVACTFDNIASATRCMVCESPI